MGEVNKSTAISIRGQLVNECGQLIPGARFPPGLHCLIIANARLRRENFSFRHGEPADTHTAAILKATKPTLYERSVRSGLEPSSIQFSPHILTAFPDIPVEQRVDMVHRLESDAGYRRKVGLHLIELLDRIDSHRKPGMIGEVFAEFARGLIDLTALHRLIAGIERLPSHEIDAVRKMESAVAEPGGMANVDSETTYAMINASFVYIESGWGGGAAKITPTCSLFLRLNLDRNRFTMLSKHERSGLLIKIGDKGATGKNSS
jgi:hypothetical protein